MGDSKLYSSHDIEKLKQKVATYKDTLTALKTGNSIDDYLFMKSEFNGLKTQISNLEGIMNEKQSTQIEEYEQQVKSFSGQIDSLNQIVKELDQDISLIMNKLKKGDCDNLLEEIITPGDIQDSLNSVKENEENEVKHIKVEATKTTDQTSNPSIRNSNLPPSYKQLRKFVNEAQTIEDPPASLTPSESIAIQKNHQEERQHFKKQSFPSNGIHPNQTYYGHYRNSATQSSITINKTSLGKPFPVIVNRNKSFILTDGDPEQNYEDINDFHKVAPNEISDQVDNVASIEVEKAPNEIPEELNNVASIEQKKAPIEAEKEPYEISNELKRQQHKNKETSRLFNLFRKKQ
ncbi:hypothetical protein [Sporosarcina sp. JAI121]|uniref:hypothetical protein n=1 Tax=Sporosarcina sp. JAI121 TaxID=2723064 RepID=UPI0015CEE0BC|nr:hypothetical protein [Sporosarcina sp. JAI121]NYF26360.1 hypothetical protein [Sporosarcina sp. JAI121]